MDYTKFITDRQIYEQVIQEAVPSDYPVLLARGHA